MKNLKKNETLSILGMFFLYEQKDCIYIHEYICLYMGLSTAISESNERNLHP